jgi:hypothetical protein
MCDVCAGETNALAAVGGTLDLARHVGSLRHLFRPRRSNTAAMIGIGDAGEKVLASRAAKAWAVRAASVVGIGELHAVVLPPAHGADLERSRRLFGEREAAAAWARPSSVRALAWRNRRRHERGPRPGSLGRFTECLNVVAARARRIDVEARGQAHRRTGRAPFGIDALIDWIGVALPPDPQPAIAVLALPSLERCGAPRARQRRQRLVPVEHAHGRRVRRATHARSPASLVTVLIATSAAPLQFNRRRLREAPRRRRHAAGADRSRSARPGERRRAQRLRRGTPRRRSPHAARRHARCGRAARACPMTPKSRDAGRDHVNFANTLSSRISTWWAIVLSAI